MCLLGVRIACELILPQELLTLDVGSIYPGYDGDLNEVQCIYIYIYVYIIVLITVLVLMMHDIPNHYVYGCVY